VDKLLECVRATYSEQSTQKEQESAQLWTDVLESIGLQANSVRQQRHTRLWELLTQCYDLLNNTDKITETQLEQYKHKIAQFGQLNISGHMWRPQGCHTIRSYHGQA
jgi:hypothetical protein